MKLPNMFSKNSKISVLNKMMCMENNSETSQMVVPQNSLTTMRIKMGMCERDTTATTATPATNANCFAIGNLSAPKYEKCPHCENMAKNLIYLESLIKSNYNSQYQCSLCYSVLKYLQFVNKRILRVFGNIDSVVGAAKLAPPPLPRQFQPHQHNMGGGRKGKGNNSFNTARGSKHRLIKQKSKIAKLGNTKSSKNVLTKRDKMVSGISLTTANTKKVSKSRSKIKLRKANNKNRNTIGKARSVSKLKTKKSNLKNKTKSTIQIKTKHIDPPLLSMQG